ncbi:LOW QUALITY PROTEIN: hypothetical protein BT93_H0817 [Corymbia citriodora subsp. variegata]|nr:LOW QUALITY PROTEIN: hypothetical protein BT93_H0817 [Corymbia citriodora subsp. variegata]
MNGSTISWFVLAISTISIFSNVARALASAKCLDVDQRSLLLELRNSLVFNTSKSPKLIQWDQSADSWSGVMCKDGLVVSLDLSKESISGGINGSSSFFRLEFLRSLNLAFKDFDSTAIPSGPVNLSRLAHLNLSYAGFSGQIPVELSRLTKLRALDLSYLYYGGWSLLKLEKPNLRSLIGDLGELRELYLDGVNVSAKGMPKLEVLSMPFCSLSGPIDPLLMILANLLVIRLKGNNLSSTVPRFVANFSGLKTLSLYNCSLHGEFPLEIFQEQTLQTLDLSCNELLQGSSPEFPKNGSLQTLLLSDTNMFGRHPDSIGNLKNLSRIKLENCNFGGNIPSSFTNLLPLSHLDFSSHNFIGPIPSLSKSKSLTRITLRNNSLTSPIDSIQWESLSSRLSLDLQINLLEGNIPSSLFTHPPIGGSLDAPSHVLNIVDLSFNNIGGELPTSIWELRGLTGLLLYSNNFSGSFHINQIQQLRNLSDLYLSYNRFSIDATNTASQASSFPSLATLYLVSCQLTILPQFLANQSKLITLGNLFHLNLSSNLFEDFETPLSNLTSYLSVVGLHSNMLQGNMPPLSLYASHLDFSSNNLNSVIPDDIGNNLPNLMFFSLSKNNFQVGYLEVLDLSHNYLNGTIPDCLMEVESLKVLNMRNNQLNGDIPQNISRTCSLKILDISKNLLRGQIPLLLANCATLDFMNMGENKIDGTFPCHFESILNLRVLVLRSNKLHGEIKCPHSRSTWQMLQIIDLSSNDFGGALPTSLLASWEAMKANVDFSHLRYRLPEFVYDDTMTVTLKDLKLELIEIPTIFTSIDLSANRLEGPIPYTLGDLKALYVLNLSHYAISVSIPHVLGNLDKLESLDLSRNYLNGTILAQLANLNFLSLLNLLDNQLVGNIPTSGQFLMFSTSSFEGNLGCAGFKSTKVAQLPRTRRKKLVTMATMMIASKSSFTWAYHLDLSVACGTFVIH